MKYLILVSMLLLTSCIQKAIESVIPQKDYKAVQVEKVKSIAIVAFDVMQFQPTGVGSKISGHFATAQMASNMDPVENELAADAYGYLADQFKAKKVRVISYSQIASNANYKTIFEVRRHDQKEKMGANHFQKPFVVKGILRPTNADYLLTADQIKTLGKELGVDAVVLARVSYTSQQRDFLGLGIANIYLRSDLVFSMFETAKGQKIWFDRGFLGTASDESIGKVSGMENPETIQKLNRSIAQKTIENFFKR